MKGVLAVLQHMWAVQGVFVSVSVGVTVQELPGRRSCDGTSGASRHEWSVR